MSIALSLHTSAETDIPETWKPTLELAVQEVFDIMTGVRIDPASDLAELPEYQFTAMIGLAGRLRGTICLRCSADSAEFIASKMLAIDRKKAGEQMCDALGELCSVIAGNFKSKLIGMAQGCVLSVPTVIIGGNYSLHSFADRGVIQLSFSLKGSPILITLGIHS